MENLCSLADDVIFSPAEAQSCDNEVPLWCLRPRGGTCENFDRDARVIFLGLKFTKMSFFWVSLSWRHFCGIEKIAVIFLG